MGQECPWGRGDPEFAMLGYIDGFGHRRLHGEITEDGSRSRRQSPKGTRIDCDYAVDLAYTIA
jgi:hypothetical protein